MKLSHKVIIDELTDAVSSLIIGIENGITTETFCELDKIKPGSSMLSRVRKANIAAMSIINE